MVVCIACDVSAITGKKLATCISICNVQQKAFSHSQRVDIADVYTHSKYSMLNQDWQRNAAWAGLQYSLIFSPP